MSDTPGSLMRRAAVRRVPSLSARGAPRRAISGAGTAGPDFLSRADFHLSANALLLVDRGSSASCGTAYFGGDADIFDYVFGRMSVLADYHAVLGDEYRPFDPNQAYYASKCRPRTGLGENRDRRRLSSRVAAPQRPPEAVRDRLERRGRAAAASGRRQGLHLRHAGRGRAESSSTRMWIIAGPLTSISWRVIRSIPASDCSSTSTASCLRSTDRSPTGVRRMGDSSKAGLRINGHGGALELFAGGERRLDADPLDRQTHSWGIAGFRLLSR